MYGIYANIGGILMGSMLPYIAAPWILWATKNNALPFVKYQSAGCSIMTSRWLMRLKPDTFACDLRIPL